MKRITTTPRPDFKAKLEELSFEFHSLNNEVYWDESAYYSFTMDQINILEEATNKLHEMCLVAVQHVIDNDLYDQLYINRDLVPLIQRSWENEEASVYGRFDLAWDGTSSPKMLEYNADTPTSLYEASVVQWKWLQDVAKDKDQFNSIHERLIGYWKGCKGYFAGHTVYFSCLKETVEDFTTVEYLRDTAHQAGLTTKFIYIEDIGFVEDDGVAYVDLEGFDMEHIFKLYPWEWMIHEEFGKGLNQTDTEWIEPAWKTILSNKGILPILWQLFPDSPYLLPAYYDEPPAGMVDYVAKPIYSREGANVQIWKGNVNLYETEGEYGDEGFIVQERYPIPYFDGNFPVIGSWVIAGEAAGIGIRESDKLVTDNFSRFVPHIIEN